MKPTPMDHMLTKTKDLVKSNVIDKTKDLGAEITRAFAPGQQNSIQNKIVYLLTAIIIVYFACMDILIYFHVQGLKPRTKEPVFGDKFDYFGMLSIKGMMEDQVSCHFIWPTCELLEMGTHISKAPLMTASGVSVFGAIIAIPAAKLMSMESLLAKRVGILVFVFRLWMDGLDGVVFRMQNLKGAEKHTQLSVRHSTGWLVDFLCDLFAAIAFLYGSYHTLKQTMSRYSTSHTVSVLPMTCPPYQSASSSPRPSSPTLGCDFISRKYPTNRDRGEREVSMRAVYIKLIWATLSILAASGLWDYFVAQYRAVFEVTLPTAERQVLQNRIFKQNSTFLVLWLWRLFNGVSLINTAYLATIYDRLWEYLQWLQLLGTASLILLTVFTMIHLNSVRHSLGIHSH